MSRYVYFATALTDGLTAVKIGVARRPHSRMRELQCGSPTKINLFAYVAGDEALERKLHATFAPLSLRGEWFAMEGKLRDFLGYLEGEAEENNREVSWRCFEVAIGDNVAVPSWMPVMSMSEEEYEATADASLWAEYA